MYHIFFIHSFVDRHLGCPFLDIVYSAAVNNGVPVSFWIMVFSGYMPKSGTAESYGSSIFTFYRMSILFSIAAIVIYISTNRIGGFCFLHTLSSIYCL